VVTLDDLFEAATKHGMASEADHEIGDLQDALLAAWELMSDEQHLELNKHPLVVAIFAAADLE
jgi:hypothetical protein